MKNFSQGIVFSGFSLIVLVGCELQANGLLAQMAQAKDLYNNSEYKEAGAMYKEIHKQLAAGTVEKDSIEKSLLIEAHVNYADVEFAGGVSALDNGNKEKARKKMLRACDHWAHRLEGGQFGRVPLGVEEWDGSDLNGQDLVVFSECAAGRLGDSFFMSWLMLYLKSIKGAKITFVPQKPLKKFYEMPGTLQSEYVDGVCVRGDALPEGAKKIYLWSALKYYLQDESITNENLFPINPWLSGTGSDEVKEILNKHKHKLLVGFWYRSSGENVNFGADFRHIPKRDVGANNIVAALQKIPGIQLVNLEGMGSRPVSTSDYEELKAQGRVGNLDERDVCECDTSDVLNFADELDKKDGAFVGTTNTMEEILKRGGVLIGCDTGLLNLAASLKSNDNKKASIHAVLNKTADMRWGREQEKQEDGTIEPRRWFLSKNVMVFQAPEQNAWPVPLAQIKAVIEVRAEEHQKQMAQQSDTQ